MYNERFDFLPLKPGGSSMMIVGGFDQPLAARLAELFEHVVAAD